MREMKEVMTVTKDKQKVLITILALLLILALGYVAFDKAKSAYNERIIQAQQQGYVAGVTDAIASAYVQTNDCQVTTLYLGNATRQIADYECLKRAAEAQKTR